MTNPNNYNHTPPGACPVWYIPDSPYAFNPNLRPFYIIPPHNRLTTIVVKTFAATNNDHQNAAIAAENPLDKCYEFLLNHANLNNPYFAINIWASNYSSILKSPGIKIFVEARKFLLHLDNNWPSNFDIFVGTLYPLIHISNQESIDFVWSLVCCLQGNLDKHCPSIHKTLTKILNQYHQTCNSTKNFLERYIKKITTEYIKILVADHQCYIAKSILNHALEAGVFSEYKDEQVTLTLSIIEQLISEKQNEPFVIGSYLNEILSNELPKRSDWDTIYTLILSVTNKLINGPHYDLKDLLPECILEEISPNYHLELTFAQNEVYPMKSLGIMIIYNCYNLDLIENQKNMIKKILGDHFNEAEYLGIDISDSTYLDCIQSSSTEKQFELLIKLINRQCKSQNIDLTFNYINKLFSLLNVNPELYKKSASERILIRNFFMRIMQEKEDNCLTEYKLAKIYVHITNEKFVDLFFETPTSKIKILSLILKQYIKLNSSSVNSEVRDIATLLITHFYEDNPYLNFIELMNLLVYLPISTVTTALNNSQLTEKNKAAKSSLAIKYCNILLKKNCPLDHFTKALSLAEKNSLRSTSLCLSFLQVSYQLKNNNSKELSWSYFLEFTKTANITSLNSDKLIDCWIQGLTNILSFSPVKLQHILHNAIEIDSVLTITDTPKKKDLLRINLVKILLKASRKHKESKTLIKKALKIRSEVNPENCNCTTRERVNFLFLSAIQGKSDREIFLESIPLFKNTIDNLKSSKLPSGFSENFVQICKSVGNDHFFNKEDLPIVIPFILELLNKKIVSREIALINFSKNSSDITQKAAFKSLSTIVNDKSMTCNCPRTTQTLIFTLIDNLINQGKGSILLKIAELLEHPLFKIQKFKNKTSTCRNKIISKIIKSIKTKNLSDKLAVIFFDYLKKLTYDETLSMDICCTAKHLIFNGQNVDDAITALENEIKRKVNVRRNDKRKSQLIEINGEILNFILEKISANDNSLPSYLNQFKRLFITSISKSTVNTVTVSRLLQKAILVSTQLDPESRKKLQLLTIPKITVKNFKYLEKEFITVDFCETLINHIIENREKYPITPYVFYNIFQVLITQNTNLSVLNTLVKFVFLLPTEDIYFLDIHRKMCFEFFFSTLKKLMNSNLNINNEEKKITYLLLVFLTEKISQNIFFEEENEPAQSQININILNTIIDKLLENTTNVARKFAVTFLMNIESQNYINCPEELKPLYEKTLDFFAQFPLTAIVKENKNTLGLHSILQLFYLNMLKKSENSNVKCPAGTKLIYDLIFDRYLKKLDASTSECCFSNIVLLKIFILQIHNLNILDNNLESTYIKMFQLLKQSLNIINMQDLSKYYQFVENCFIYLISCANSKKSRAELISQITSYFKSYSKKIDTIDKVVLLKDLLIFLTTSFITEDSETYKKLHVLCLNQIHRSPKWKHVKQINEIPTLLKFSSK